MNRLYVMLEYQYPGEEHATTIEGWLGVPVDASVVGQDFDITPSTEFYDELLVIKIPLKWVVSIYPTSPTLGVTSES